MPNIFITVKKMKQEKWDRRFLRLADEISTWSKDESTKVGCLIVGPNKEIRSTGYNGFPIGVKEKKERLKKPDKYLYTEHSERNAVYLACRNHVSLNGCTAYVTHFPCADCARAFVQCGIKRVVSYETDFVKMKNWVKSFDASGAMLIDAGIEYKFYKKEE